MPTTFLLVYFSSLKESTFETRKMFFISLQKLFSFSRNLSHSTKKKKIVKISTKTATRKLVPGLFAFARN